VADIEDNTQTQRRDFTREVLNLLLDLIFEKLEVFRFEIRDDVILRIRDGDVHHDEVYIDLDALLRTHNACGRQHKYNQKKFARHEWQHHTTLVGTIQAIIHAGTALKSTLGLGMKELSKEVVW
jgi:hypothetical protein